MSWDSNCGKRKDKNWSLIITTDIGRWAFFGSANWPSCCIFAMHIRLLTSELKNTRESELIKAPIKDWASTHCGTVLSTLQTLTLFPTRRLVKELVREVKASEWQQNLTPGSSVQSLRYFYFSMLLSLSYWRYLTIPATHWPRTFEN